MAFAGRVMTSIPCLKVLSCRSLVSVWLVCLRGSLVLVRFIQIWTGLSVDSLENLVTVWVLGFLAMKLCFGCFTVF